MSDWHELKEAWPYLLAVVGGSVLLTLVLAALVTLVVKIVWKAA